ncbi:MAG: DUF4276 family protein [Myxococcota bacterium]
MNEEESMGAFLRGVLPAAFPQRQEDVDWILIGHQGRTDLEQSIGRKARAWSEPNARFMITRDNDGGDCRALKTRLVDLLGAPPERPFKIRIVCQELESWLLGDLEALTKAYPQAKRHASFRTWSKRDPDTLTNASDVLRQLTGTRAKVQRAETIGRHSEPKDNRSLSFQTFLSGMRTLFSEK